MKFLHTLNFILLVVGGLNWGLTVFGYGVERFVGSSVANIVYILVALAAVIELFTHRDYCKHCEVKPGTPVQSM